MEFTLSKGDWKNKVLYKNYDLWNNLHSQKLLCNSLFPWQYLADGWISAVIWADSFIILH